MTVVPPTNQHSSRPRPDQIRSASFVPRLLRRRLAWWTLGLGLAVVASFLGRSSDHNARPEWAEADLAAETEPVYVAASDTVRRGDTFSAVLMRNRVSVQEIGRILEANRRIQYFSPRNLQPGQVVTVTRDEYGRFQKLRMEVSYDEIYVFESRDDSMLAYPEDIDREIRLRKLGGEVHSTFDEALLGAGGDYRLSLKLADLFAYDVDFYTDVHRGDRFEVLVEERYANGRRVGFGEILYGEYVGKEAAAEAVWFKLDGSRKGAHYDMKGQALRKSFLKSPLNYRRISSTFGSRFHPILKKWRPHHGVDYAAAAGTPVVAVADGSVHSAGWKGGYGKAITLRHAGKSETIYGHLSKFAKDVHSGARVRQGQVIGYVGQTGLATGPHLHYELIQDGKRIDPLKVKNLPAEPIPPADLARFNAWTRQIRDLDESLATGAVLDRFDPRQLPSALAQAHGEVDPAVR